MAYEVGEKVLVRTYYYKNWGPSIVKEPKIAYVTKVTPTGQFYVDTEGKVRFKEDDSWCHFKGHNQALAVHSDYTHLRVFKYSDELLGELKAEKKSNEQDIIKYQEKRDEKRRKLDAMKAKQTAEMIAAGWDICRFMDSAQNFVDGTILYQGFVPSIKHEYTYLIVRVSTLPEDHYRYSDGKYEAAASYIRGQNKEHDFGLGQFNSLSGEQSDDLEILLTEIARYVRNTHC